VDHRQINGAGDNIADLNAFLSGSICNNFFGGGLAHLFTQSWLLFLTIECGLTEQSGQSQIIHLASE
jgi:hypothetical protein